MFSVKFNFRIAIFWEVTMVFISKTHLQMTFDVFSCMLSINVSHIFTADQDKRKRVGLTDRPYFIVCHLLPDHWCGHSNFEIFREPHFSSHRRLVIPRGPLVSNHWSSVSSQLQRISPHQLQYLFIQQFVANIKPKDCTNYATPKGCTKIHFIVF